MRADFINLSNGVEALPRLAALPHFCRLQSSHCESKHWEGLVDGAGPDLLLHLAAGYEITVWDGGKEHEPRALWQGIPMLQFFCQSAWGIVPDPVIVRSGMRVDSYAEEVWQRLPASAKQTLRWYRRWLAPCATGRMGRSWVSTDADGKYAELAARLAAGIAA